MTLEELQKRRACISEKIDTRISNMEKLANESARVAEVAANSERILNGIDAQFERCTGLNKLDTTFLFVAVGLQLTRQYLLTNFPERVDDQTAAKNTKGHMEEHSDRSHRYYKPKLEEIISNPVPFDANIGANGALAGGASMGHRVTALGHDPVLGLIIGTANIATSTLTNKDLRSYHIYTNQNNRDYFRNNANTGMIFSKTKDKLLNEGLDGKILVGTSLMKEVIHLKSDINTKKSLPLPFLSVIDAKLAANLAERGLDMCNVVTVGKQISYSVLINTLIAMIHGLFFDESTDINRKVYSVRTRKILSYSNIIASTSNLIYAGGNALIGNEASLKSLDIGGLLVTIYRIVTDSKVINSIKREFIQEEFFSRIRGTGFDFE